MPSNKSVVDAPSTAPHHVRSLSGLAPFLRPYRGRIALAGAWRRME